MMPISTRLSNGLPLVSCEWSIHIFGYNVLSMINSFNHGQCCCAGSRVFVQSGIYEKFSKAFQEHVKTLKVGDPFEPDVFQGPQVSQIQQERIMGYIESGKKDGATCTMGGDRHGDEGFFVQPTVFTDTNPNMKIVQEEIFGPVVVSRSFSLDFYSPSDLALLGIDQVRG
jgi:acyl-CoA reductase-like NAD-dependent aldehyde dehydrogenase